MMRQERICVGIPLALLTDPARPPRTLKSAGQNVRMVELKLLTVVQESVAGQLEREHQRPCGDAGLEPVRP